MFRKFSAFYDEMQEEPVFLFLAFILFFGFSSVAAFSAFEYHQEIKIRDNPVHVTAMIDRIEYISGGKRSGCYIDFHFDVGADEPVREFNRSVTKSVCMKNPRIQQVSVFYENVSPFNNMVSTDNVLHVWSLWKFLIVEILLSALPVMMLFRGLMHIKRNF